MKVIKEYFVLTFNLREPKYKYLRAKIAETIFEESYRFRLSSILFDFFKKHNVVLCPTIEVARFLCTISIREEENEIIVHFPEYLPYEIHGSMKIQEALKQLRNLHDEISEKTHELELAIKGIRERISELIKKLDSIKAKLGIASTGIYWNCYYETCLLCGEWSPYRVCDNCSTLMCKRLNGNEFTEAYKLLGTIDNLVIKLEETSKEYESLRSELRSLEYFIHMLEFIAKFKPEEILFLKKVYCEEKITGPPSFDYVAVSSDGSKKYLIDVTSTISRHHAGLSPKEKEVAKRALRRGFKILMPIIYFEDDWNITIRVMELGQT